MARKPFKRKFDTRQSVDIKSQFKKVDTGIKNGVFIFSSPLTVEQFASKLSKTPSEILKHFFLKGKMLNMNALLSEEEIGELCLEFNYDFEKKTEINEMNVLSNLNVEDDVKELKPRPPIVTIMGHVDHGKTTLLDYIRKTHVAKGEAGGITQHIGAYQISRGKERITFIDTPGHAAFTEMRSRGANVTDIVIIVVAADDGIKPQTEEAIDHAKAAKVPLIVFINKMDKPNANPDRALSQLSEKGIVSDEWGGDTITIKGSALTGSNVDKLLDAIMTVAELAEFEANPNRLGMGVVIESNIDRGFGPVASVLVKNGSLKKGDFIIIGSAYGHIRAMFDENSKELSTATPSQPVKIVGLNKVPIAGDHFVVSNNEKDIKELAKKIENQQNLMQRKSESDSITALDPNTKQLNIILKTDVHGSLEAIRGMLAKIDVAGTKISIIRSAVGAITESDIQLAKVSNAIIIGFNIKPSRAVKETADMQKITIYFHDIIYRLNEMIINMLQGSLDPIFVEEETGEADIKQVWKHSEVGTIAGCYVTSGELNRNDKVRILRDGVPVVTTTINSMKHVKENVNKVTTGMECGIVLEKYNDIRAGDVVQTYKIIEKKRGE